MPETPIKEKSRISEQSLASVIPKADDQTMTQDLTGQFLIAMPAMNDPRFAQSVIYLCSHSDEGAMGLIINKPAPHLRLSDLTEQLGLTDEGARLSVPNARVFFGGPVEMTRGFVLHSDDYHRDGATMDVAEGIAMTSSLDILSDILEGQGPGSSVLALGYSGWGPGQLEDEFADNAWLVAPGQDDILFGRAHDHKWSAALKSIGVSPLMLSSESGQA